MIKICSVIFAALITFNISVCTKATEIKRLPYTVTVVNISLPKKIYKMYEPIELQYEWINYKDEPDTIWALFSSSAFIKQFITDEQGKVYKNNYMELDAMYMPQYFVAKGDTLKKTITLNHSGKKFADSMGEQYFHCFNYFPPGKYKVYSVIDRDVIKEYPEPIKTNEIEFEITGLTDQDENILALAQKEKYEEALNLYPSNYFDEHLMKSEINMRIKEFYKAGEMNERYKDTSVLPEKYEAFFEKYPNSLYNLGDGFLIRYLRVSSRDSAGAQLKMEELLNKYPGTNIARTVNEIMQRQNRTGDSWIYIRNYHKNNGKSKEVIPDSQMK